MNNQNGFSLIEIVVVMGILSLLVASVLFVGFPEYDRYIISCERSYLVDALLESRARSLVGGNSFVVSTWSNGYCLQDALGLCVTPFHNLPENMVLDNVNFATSTKLILKSTLQTEINIDQNGFIIDQ